jgi:hypothetical protein
MKKGTAKSHFPFFAVASRNMMQDDGVMAAVAAAAAAAAAGRSTAAFRRHNLLGSMESGNFQGS